MIVKIGTRIYETDFSVDDLWTFYKYGVGYTVQDKIIDGGRYFYFNRRISKEQLAGSQQAIVEINPTILNFPTEEGLGVGRKGTTEGRELPL